MIEFGKTRVAVVCGGRRYGETFIATGEINPDRHWQRERLTAVLDAAVVRLKIEAIVTGSCPTGADYFAELWAQERRIPHQGFLADWKAQGRAAGPIRNRQMLRESMAVAVIAFPGGPGSADMVRLALEEGVALYEIDRRSGVGGSGPVTS